MSTSDKMPSSVTAAMPASLRAAVAAYQSTQWTRDSVGESDAAVYRLRGKGGAPDLYLKHGRGSAAADLADELARLRWLAPYLPVPAVVQFARVADPEQAWLLLTAMPGTTASSVLEANPALGPVVVDADDFDAGRQGWTAEQVWTALQDCQPITPDLVVTHGDFSLENIVMQEGAVVACIDVGRAGVADRYQDLAIAWRALGELDAALPQRLLQQYGIVDADQGKLQWHLLLDELF